MKHKFVDFTNAKRDFGEKLILQFIGFAQSHVTLHQGIAKGANFV